MGEYLEFIQDTNYEATSLSEQRERETSGSIEKIYRSNNDIRKGKDSHKAASTFCPPDGGKRRARGTRESASGGPAG